MDNEIILKPEPARQDFSPVEIAIKLKESGLTIENMQSIMDTQKKWEAEKALKAYNVAMSEFKRNPPIIEKNKNVSHVGGRYNYASLSNVVGKIGSELAKYDLSASWRTQQSDKLISVTCRVMHSLGHFEETTLSAPPDSSGSKNIIQAIGSTVSYLQRYTLLSLTGLATDDMDNDGGGKIIDPEKLKQLEFEAKTLNEAEMKKFLNLLKVEELKDLQDQDFQKALNILSVKKKAAQK